METETTKFMVDLKQSIIEHDALGQMVDVYCNARTKLDPVIEAGKIAKKELDEIEVPLLAQIDEVYADTSEMTKTTELWKFAAGAKGKVFTVTDKKKLIELLGIDNFCELAEISVTDMRKYLTPNALKLVGKEVNKNKRRIKYAEA